MKLTPISYVYIGIMAFALFFGIYATTYPTIKTTGLPLVVSGFIFLLALISLIKEFKTEQQKKTDKTATSNDGETISFAGFVGYIKGFSWMAGYILAIYILGFIPSTALFMFSYLKSNEKGWFFSAALAILGTGAIYFTFVIFFHVPLSEGVLWRLLSR